ncbi:MAG: HD domain-containing protein [Nitrospirae bacterium]|nr:HD domain-containing protein [Nitrospirota bacterium]
MTETARAFVTAFTSALSNCSLYSAEHEIVEELARKAFLLLEQWVAETGGVEVIRVEDDLIVNKTPLRDAGIHGANLVRRLKRKGISRVGFLNGVAFPELRQFIAGMAEPDGEIRQLSHIRTGTVEVRLASLGPEVKIDAEGLSLLASLQVERTKTLYHGIASRGRLNVAGVEEIVNNFISALRKKTDFLKLLRPVPFPMEHAYTHAVNVAVLSMYQAETLGAKDELLYDIGIAALLHDVGKLFLRGGVGEKEGALKEQEWEELRRHTVYGARYLARNKGLTRVAPLVALEHHRRYDGQGYPGMAGKERRQHLFTQIIAIADFLDSMRNRRAGNEGGIAGMVSLMEQGAGKEFNPFLIEHFSKVVALSLKEEASGEGGR